MKYTEPNLNNPLVDATGKALDGLRLWINNVTGAQLQDGTGSPEGVIKANKNAQYVDTDTDTLYYKKLAEISGDSSQGWTAL